MQKEEKYRLRALLPIISTSFWRSTATSRSDWPPTFSASQRSVVVSKSRRSSWIQTPIINANDNIGWTPVLGQKKCLCDVLCHNSAGVEVPVLLEFSPLHHPEPLRGRLFVPTSDQHPKLWGFACKIIKIYNLFCLHNPALRIIV